MNKCKLAEFVEQYGDGIHGTPNYDDNGTYYFINGNNLLDGKINITNDTKKISKEEYDKIKRPLTDNTLLVSINGTLGRMAIYKDEPITLGKSVCYINLKENKNKYFIKYVLSTLEFQKYIQLVASGSTIKNLSPSQIVDYKFYLPTKEDQEKIALLLKCIDDKIENNNKINAELEEMAKIIYDYWFLQFEFPNEEGKPYKSSGGKMVWNEELKREIPEGWECGILNDFILKDKGGDWGKESCEGNYTEEVTCIRGADFPSLCGSVQLVAPKRFILEKNKNKKLEDGDIIIEISGGSPTQSTGRVCYINENTLRRFNTDIITSNFCKAISLKDKKHTYWFYMLWKTLYENDVFFKYEGKTTGIKNLLFDMLCNDYKIIIPKENIIEDYNFKIKEVFNKIQQNYIENQELSSLRDFLLPLLMNGQVGFKEVALAEDK